MYRYFIPGTTLITHERTLLNRINVDVYWLFVNYLNFCVDLHSAFCTWLCDYIYQGLWSYYCENYTFWVTRWITFLSSIWQENKDVPLKWGTESSSELVVA